MKRFVLLSTLLISSGISAASRDLYDVMYLPQAGTAYGSSTLGFGKITRESKALGDLDLDGIEFSQSLGYALSDRFSLTLDMDYSKIEAEAENGDKYDSAKGISDPALTARLRLIDEAFRLDVVGAAIVNFQDREVEENGDTNNTQGGHTFVIGPELGVKAESVQWFIGGYLVHNLSAETKYKLNSLAATVEDEANNELLLRTSLLHRLYQKNFLRWNAQGRFSEEVGNDRENLIGKTAPSTTYELGVEYEYAASDSVLIYVGGNYQQFNTRSGQIDEAYGWNSYLGANYQF